ncbi:MAG: hypothetical protein JXN61_00115, partial [Sedimentisphaerales bacterium]|nr:hypothetical protein [Sedimentisphaerales bacterium]
VVGTACTASGVQAFRWTAAEGIVGVPIPAGLVKSWATDVSEDGNYVLGHGRKSDSPPYDYEGFRWHVSGGLDRIAAPGLNIIAKGLSGDGAIAVGTSWGVDIDDEVFRWTAQGGITRLVGLPAGGANRTNADGISADGLVVVGDGIYDGDPYRDCFRWTEAEVLTFSAHTANATSSDGAVVVGTLDNHETALFEAYRWTAQTGTVLLGTCLPNFHSRALAVSGDGSVIVGYVQNNSGFDEQKAFIWDAEHGMRLLQQVLEGEFGLDLSGWKIAESWASWRATGISADGLTIVGDALNGAGLREGWRAILRSAVYVDKDATGANNGSTWADAYNYLQDALMFAAPGDEIRVAEGVYKPDDFVLSDRPNREREETFQLINGVAVKGGYAGFGRPDPDARDVNEYETILTGDRLGNDVAVADAADLLDEPSREDNCYHVVTGHETDSTAVLDGFTITGGNANWGYWVAWYGGGITADSAGLTIRNCKIQGNVAAQGGGLHIGSGGATLSGCTFSGNAAIHAGGMINGGRQTTVADCAFLDNYADTGGGATICTDATFARCNFVRNRAGLSTGGAVGNDCSAPEFEHCTFIENTAPYAGGAISNFEGDLVIVACRFVGNSSDKGGAIYQGDTDTVLTACEFEGNHAVTGGAIANDGYSDPTLTDCNFTGNWAQFGGAFHNTTGSAPGFANCVFSGNSATGSGGAIGSYNNYGFGPILIGCTFNDNTAPNGGGYYNDDGDPILTDCRFNRNQAEQEGGGFYNLTGKPTLEGCLFVENRSDQDGGGMQNDDGSPKLTGCVFRNNFAADEGGGMCNEDDNAPPLNPVLVNCIFAGNVANSHGGAMCNDRSNPSLTNCTFSGNTAEAGGGMYGENGSAVSLSNCILRSDAPDELHNDGAATTVLFSDVQGGCEGKGNIDADPRFADPNSGDYHLKSQAGRYDPNNGAWTIDDVTSPCIDAGDPMSPIGYEPFPNGGIINMGAYGGAAEASKSYFAKRPCETIVAGDVNGDCVIDFRDFSIMALHWCRENGN